MQSNATKFIFFSSVKAVAESVINEPLLEDVSPTPKGPYGESKLAAENYILRKLTESYIVSNQKIKTALGIEKMPVTAREGLKRTFESFR